MQFILDGKGRGEGELVEEECEAVACSVYSCGCLYAQIRGLMDGRYGR